jgi:hypothetical protein
VPLALIHESKGTPGTDRFDALDVILVNLVQMGLSTRIATTLQVGAADLLDGLRRDGSIRPR